MNHMQLPAGMRRVFLDPAQKFPAIEIETPWCRACIAMQGAQLLRMEVANGQPLLWLSPSAQFVPGKAVRGGIPLCFPWFGPHSGNPSLPAHGFARTREWLLVSAERSEKSALLVFELRDDDATRALWPHGFLARITYLLGHRLDMSFSVTNTGHESLAFGFALHSYFPVSDIRRTRVAGLEGVPFIDKLTDGNVSMTERVPVDFNGETDRVYRDAGGDYRVIDDERGVALAITASQCRSAVVWNPWQEKSARLGDVPGDAWRQFVCVECGEVGAQDVVLRAGETRTFRQVIRHLS